MEIRRATRDNVFVELEGRKVRMAEQSRDDTALAVLFAALVEALDEQKKGVAESFARHLETAQARLPPDMTAPDVLATLSRTRALLREDIDRAEPAYLIYAKRLAATEDMLPSTDKIALPTFDDAVRFWARLPAFDRESASVETASGHRFDAPALSVLYHRLAPRPQA